MYRDMIYTSLAKANPAFLSRLSAYDRLEGFIDTISDFAGDAHFQIEKQIIDQYTQSEEYNFEKNDMKKVNSTLKHIDESVMKMIPDLIEQALMPGSEMMQQLEREEEEFEQFQKSIQQLFRDRAVDDTQDSGAGIILEEGGLDELMDLDLSVSSAGSLVDMIRLHLKAATAAQERSAGDASGAGTIDEGHEAVAAEDCLSAGAESYDEKK